MKTNLACAMLLAAGLLLAGCSATGEKADTAGGRVKIGQSDMDRVANVKWRLVKMVVAGETVPLIEHSEVRLTLGADGKVGGLATLNRFFGAFQFKEDGKIAWPSPFGATRMAGPENMMAQEDRFLNALPETDLIFTRDDTMWLESSNGAVVLEFKKEMD